MGVVPALSLAVACPLCGLTLLDQGLRRYSSLFITPAYQAAVLSMGALSGAAFWGDLENASVAEHCVFGLSLVAVVTGINFCGTAVDT
eukprot:SAG22_NODE_2022_length_3123_cov_12.497354_2_plen_88_part_00